MPKKRKLDIRFLNEAADAVESFAKITGRSIEEVESDLHRVYEWVLHEQLRGRKIISEGSSEGEAELEYLIVDQEAAEAYFLENIKK